MLAAEALRLAAIEVLCPTASLEAGGPFPTLAGRAVFDSEPASLQSLDRNAPAGYTPVISLYTSEAAAQLMGEASAAVDTQASAMLVIIAELAVVAEDNEGEFVAPMAEDDPEARMVLAALCSQIRFKLERSTAGGAWRRLVRRIERVDMSTFAAPDFGLKYQRVMMRFACSIRDDEFDVENGGLPEPIRSVHAALPANSYAKAKLAALAAHFAADPATALEGAGIDTGTPVQGDVSLSDE
ncbi:hypothetical protein [uncultured Martelella sp.]|uniref:hypothetical protein n=1 Tax=uncultured Martelella sp. TaxID=392331 RepID=UPI0029C75D33|nr:hypothetical protein [uncultured Martelella sp.]